MGQQLWSLLRRTHTHTHRTLQDTGYSLFSYCRLLGTVIGRAAAKPSLSHPSSLRLFVSFFFFPFHLFKEGERSPYFTEG